MKRRRAAAGAVGHVAAVTDEVESEFAVGRFGRRVDLFAGHLDAAVAHDQLEVRDRPFDRLLDLLLVGKHRSARRADIDRPGGQVLDRLCDDLQALVAFRPCGPGSGRSSHRLVMQRTGNRNPRRPGTVRPCEGPGSRRWPGRSARKRRRLIASSRLSTPTPLVRSTKMRLRLSSRSMSCERLRESRGGTSRIFSIDLRRDVVHQPADAGVAVGESGSAEGLEDVVDLLALVEGVEEERERARCRVPSRRRRPGGR